MASPVRPDPVEELLRRQRAALAASVDATATGSPGGRVPPGDPVAELLRRQSTATPVAPVRRPRPRGLDQGVGALEKFLQTVNPFQDELTGAVQAVGALAPGGRSPREAYVQERDASRARTAQFAEDDPAGSALATGAGIATTLAAGPARAAAKAFPMVIKGIKGSLQAAGVGAGKAAAYAAPYALGAAEGTPGEQVAQTVRGTALAGGLGAVLGPVANRLSRRGARRGSLAKAAEVGGTDPARVLAERAALDPAVRAATPALTNVGPVEAALVNRTLRTRKGAKLGRVVEQRLNALDVQRRAVGEAKKTLFQTPTPVADPGILETLTGARQNPAFEKVVRAVQKDLAGKNQIVGDVTKKFSGTIEEALAVGIPEADILARAADPKMLGSLLSNPAARAFALKAPVGKGFTYTESHPYTLEFFDRLQRASRKALRKDYKAGGSATTELVETVNSALVNQVRNVHPEYDALQRQYGQLKRVIEQTGKRVRPRFDPAAPMGQRFEITAHPGAPALLPTTGARAGADPLGSGGQTSAIITALRYFPQKAQERVERTATSALLKTGQEGDEVLYKALFGAPPRKIPAGAFRLPGLLSAP